MENPALNAVFHKNAARKFLESNGEVTEELRSLLLLQADLVLNTYSCINCDDRKCMGCIFREYDHECQDDCPFCCMQSD